MGKSLMTPVQINIFRWRELQILAEGLSIEICMQLGDTQGAHWHRREMEALIAAREASIQQIEEEGGCYFIAAGEVARMQAEARRTA
jgi:hypothetical protein